MEGSRQRRPEKSYTADHAHPVTPGNTVTNWVEPRLVNQLKVLRERARDYFEESSSEGADPYSPSHTPDYWQTLPEILKEQAATIASELAALAQLLGPAIRRSPLLTEADERAAGHALKGMRAALRLRSFRHWETEVIHDEGTVLGVHPSSESDEERIPPTQASKVFDQWADSLQARLELMHPDLDSSPELPGAVLTMPIAAGYRPGTAFVMMWMDKGPTRAR